MKKIILAAAVMAIASMAVASFASAGVQRYQTQSMTITATQPKDQISQWTDVWTHTYNVTLNPCDGSFAGTGTFVGNDGVSWPSGSDETITGQLNGDGTISYTATRPGDSEVYSLNSANLDGSTVALASDPNPAVTWPLEFKVSATTTDLTHFKNHGDYVSQAGDKADAAHSCIGMPIQ